jgi:hypothetical protein
VVLVVVAVVDADDDVVDLSVVEEDVGVVVAEVTVVTGVTWRWCW